MRGGRIQASLSVSLGLILAFPQVFCVTLGGGHFSPPHSFSRSFKKYLPRAKKGLTRLTLSNVVVSSYMGLFQYKSKLVKIT